MELPYCGLLKWKQLYGHLAGDNNCLPAVANVIKLEVNIPGDLVVLYGGEEFVVILLRKDAQGGFYIAELISKRLWYLKLFNGGSQISEFVTMSLDVASTIPLTNYSWKKLIKITDGTLYQENKEGGNQTIIQTFWTTNFSNYFIME